MILIKGVYYIINCISYVRIKGVCHGIGIFLGNSVLVYRLLTCCSIRTVTASGGMTVVDFGCVFAYGVLVSS